MDQKRLKFIGAITGSVLLVGGLGFGSVALAQTFTPEPQPTPAEEVVEETPTPTPTPTETHTPTPEPEPVVEQPPAPAPPPADPTKCPSGTTPGAVDDAGNESNCQPLNNQGQECVEYNDANQCVTWYRP